MYSIHLSQQLEQQQVQQLEQQQVQQLEQQLEQQQVQQLEQPAKASGLILARLVPERAPDENKSVLAAVLRFWIHKTNSVDFFSHKSSMISLQSIFHDSFENSRD